MRRIFSFFFEATAGFRKMWIAGDSDTAGIFIRKPEKYLLNHTVSK